MNWKIAQVWRPARRIVYGHRTYTYSYFRVLEDKAAAFSLYRETRADMVKRGLLGHGSRISLTISQTRDSATAGESWQEKRYRQS